MTVTGRVVSLAIGNVSVVAVMVLGRFMGVGEGKVCLNVGSHMCGPARVAAVNAAVWA